MINKDRLMWGKPCKRHGAKKDGTCLRYKSLDGKEMQCVLCSKDAAIYKDQDEFYAEVTGPNKPKRTEEEIRARRVAASMRWNAKNPDKFNSYVKKYNSKPEVKQRHNEKHLEKYHKMTPEEKSAFAKTQYQKFKDSQIARGLLVPKPERTQEEKEAAILARHERTKERARAKYALLTKEDKQKRYERDKKYKKPKEEDKKYD